MKILLIGEYNKSHYCLKDGLSKLGHQVLVVGLTDGFKKVHVDVEIKDYFDTWLLLKLKNAFKKIFRIDLHSISVWLQINKLKKQLSGYDIVQFINESSFNCNPKTEIKIFNLIKKQNKNLFLLSCGDDFISNTYNLNEKRYSILTPYIEGRITKKENHYSLKYLTKPYQKLHQHIFTHIKGVIASDLDYHLPLLNHPKYLGMIPNPINIDALPYTIPNLEDKIIIFHGINNDNYYKKGNDIFEAALQIIAKKYGSNVEIITTRSLPYQKYIEIYNRCHILLDQVFAYDQGFNALEAMAKGKVVFTGAEQEWLDYYHLQEDTVAINALPNAEAIAQKLSWLIENPNEILKISKNARAFIEQHHHYINSAQLYLDKWQKAIR